MPRQAGGGAWRLRGWLAQERPGAPAGVYRKGYLPPDPALPEDEEERLSTPLLLWRAVVGVAAYGFGYVCISWLVLNVLAFLGWFSPKTMSPDQFSTIESLITIVILVALIPSCARLGRWVEVYRRFLSPSGFRRNVQPALRKAVTDERRDQQLAEAAEAALSAQDPWAPLRGAGLAGALALLDADTRANRVNDVDYVRILRVHQEVAADPVLLARFAEQLAARGAGACVHPSEQRDVPAPRLAEHDLLVGQVRLGTVQDVVKNPAAHRGAAFALDRELLATSLLAVGPAGTGKTARLARPVAEALCLQALTRSACAVVVGAAEADLGPDAGYDVVIAPGDPSSPYGLDLYGAAGDPDGAAARLADALLPDELSARTESARIALQQVVGPFHAAYGRYPGPRELRALLGDEEAAWTGLEERLRAAGRWAPHESDVQHRRGRLGRLDDPGSLLADRLALLDRPAFAGCFDGTAADKPAFAMRALEHPLRVRVKLPERSHPEAARILSRLVVGQFLQAAAARSDRSLFAGLVVDDAAAALDNAAVQGLRRLPGANAGAVLLLRSLVDLPEALRVPLFGAVGCRMAFPGIAPWDGKLFSEAWGTVLVRERAVTLAPDTSGGMLRKTGRVLRKVLAGTTAQTESVTTREVERQRWSPSDLAHALPSGHAVVSLTAVTGEQVPPLLVDLRS
ncbi:ATP-binding protein [Kitasatospora sp. RB6PN24]|uniref:ATP-binding protein n=1 Tax=Kitasatospora humi TaxID=2893891 RepID=UPI001E4116A8|nr:ATP-binding protein [Kitasatospora humi]MCC9312179.1 ATP-binding protein [Kitasatospora humi]